MASDACGGKMLRVRLASAIILVLTLCSCRSVPDSTVLQGFTQHKQILEQLAEMTVQDHLSCPIPASGEANCVPAPKLRTYQSLLRAAHVFGVSPQWGRNCILFPSVQESALLAMHAHARGYAYAVRSPLLPTTSDTAAESGEKEMAFRPIEDNWYLYFRA
jgi:hypothetical protein